MRLRGWLAVSLAVALALAACGKDSSERSERRRTTTTTTAPSTTPRSVGPQTVPVPPVPPLPPTTGPPPAVTVPRGAPRTTTTTTTAATSESTTPPTVTAGPATTRGGPTSTTTKPKPKSVTRKTVVYSPPDAPAHRGDLLLPREHKDTIVVLVHGGAGSSGSRKQMRGWADFYAERGYASLAIDYVLVKPTTPAPVYPKPETDVKAAVQYLRGRADELGLDPDRIVVQGFEDGAALGAQAEVTPDDSFFGGPGHYPTVSDKPAAFVGFYGRYDGSQRNPPRYYGGPPDSPDPKVKDRYAKANSIAQAANAAGPVLLVDADGEEPAVSASSRQFHDALAGAGKDVTQATSPGLAGFDQTNGALTPDGRQIAGAVIGWLALRFPAS